MKKNMGKFDSLARVFVAVIIGILYFTGVISGTIGTVLAVVAVIFILTSIVSFCPIYTLFGMNTCKVKND